jgi:hypothetical protein
VMHGGETVEAPTPEVLQDSSTGLVVERREETAAARTSLLD